MKKITAIVIIIQSIIIISLYYLFIALNSYSLESVLKKEQLSTLSSLSELPKVIANNKNKNIIIVKPTLSNNDIYVVKGFNKNINNLYEVLPNQYSNLVKNEINKILSRKPLLDNGYSVLSNENYTYLFSYCIDHKMSLLTIAIYNKDYIDAKLFSSKKINISVLIIISLFTIAVNVIVGLIIYKKTK